QFECTPPVVEMRAVDPFPPLDEIRWDRRSTRLIPCDATFGVDALPLYMALCIDERLLALPFNQSRIGLKDGERSPSPGARLGSRPPSCGRPKRLPDELTPFTPPAKGCLVVPLRTLLPESCRDPV